MVTAAEKTKAVRETRRPEHVPDGDMCSCGVLAYYHRDRKRPEHEPQGDPCRECGRDAADHRKKRTWNRRDGRKGRSGPSGPSGPHAPYVAANAAPFVGVDGEGQNVGPVQCDACQALWPPYQKTCECGGTSSSRAGPHYYTYMAAVDEHGEVRGDLSAKRLGVPFLSTERCLNWLLDLGCGRVFGYSAGYDLAKILSGLPDEMLYDLVRPDRRAYAVERKGKTRIEHRPVHWMGFRLNYMKGRFTVQREERRTLEQRARGLDKYKTIGKGLVFWDVFRFFQGRFTLALEDWKILSQAELAAMNAMKDDRGGAAWDDSEGVQAYCRKECEALARLTRQLVTAHEDAGLKLTQFYGAGSTASALMVKLGVKEFMAPLLPEMRHACMVAFVGGRFEFSAVGPIEGPVDTDDISSAYPGQLTHLPCLTHGKWELVRRDGPGGARVLDRRIAQARLALVHARVVRTHQKAWGVFPWRVRNGSIVWPLVNPGTWVWKDEYLAGTRLADVRAVEAWVYDTQCDCRPFKELPGYYAERVRIGKEGPGIVIKLGMNSLYGKTAQSSGRPPFQSWIWAGNITSGTRAQLLTSLEVARDPWDVLGFATDAVFARTSLKLPAPPDTGTARLEGPAGAKCTCAGGVEYAEGPDCKKHVKKPLGGWEKKTHKRGMFLMRPGVYFPLNPTEEDLQSKLIKARGMSGRVLLKNADRILEHWRKYGTSETIRIDGLRRFVGMNAGITKYQEAKGKERPAVRSKDYGEWVKYPLDVSLAPKPKRYGLLDGGRMAPWPRMPGESSPYKKGRLDPEAQAEEDAKEALMDSADGDFSF